MKSSGFSIIMWQSMGREVTFRSDASTGVPIVRLGTKCPSITSKCMTVPPPASAALTSSARCAKSADRIDGSSSTKIREVYQLDPPPRHWRSLRNSPPLQPRPAGIREGIRQKRPRNPRDNHCPIRIEVRRPILALGKPKHSPPAVPAIIRQIDAGQRRHHLSARSCPIYLNPIRPEIRPRLILIPVIDEHVVRHLPDLIRIQRLIDTPARRDVQAAHRVDPMDRRI